MESKKRLAAMVSDMQPPKLCAVILTCNSGAGLVASSGPDCDCDS